MTSLVSVRLIFGSHFIIITEIVSFSQYRRTADRKLVVYMRKENHLLTIFPTRAVLWWDWSWARMLPTVVGRCVFSEPEVLDKFVDVGGDVAYLQEAASDVYAARGWIFGFGFCFSTVSGFWLVHQECTFFPADWRLFSPGADGRYWSFSSRIELPLVLQFWLSTSSLTLKKKTGIETPVVKKRQQQQQLF